MNKQQLASKIWESANKMRSKIEANEYKDYILGFMFYKFLSEKEEQEFREMGVTGDLSFASENNPKFEKEIESDNVEYLINYDYDSLIEDDAEDENKILIKNIIKTKKKAWTKLSPKQQEIIKKRIKLCLYFSQIHQLNN